jgi:arsenate reductase
MKALVYHNPRCGKSRGVLEILEKKKIEYTIKEYLKEPLTSDELLSLSKLLGLTLKQMMRTKEDVFKTLKLDQNDLSEKELAIILVKNPILLERPIVVLGKKAVIARPPEDVLAIL